jgi:hypothetical protein
MAAASLGIKLRCASWQQLATIYRRDLSKGSMFLKATSQPSVGTIVRIDLELPSGSVIELSGSIVKHVVDPQRGTGVELKLDPLPTKSVWMIESALAAENKVRAQSAGITEAPTTPSRPPTVDEGADVAEAETDLVRALEAEAESLRKLNPFLVLGVGYETSDAEVRAAFGELTKRYHPDRFARYQSTTLRRVAAEIFILIRDAYRKLADVDNRKQALVTLGPRIPTRAGTEPKGSAPSSVRVTPATGVPAAPSRVSVPPIPAAPKVAASAKHDAPTNPGAYDAPTNPSGKSAELAGTELARADALAIPVAVPEGKSGPVEKKPDPGRAQMIPTGQIAKLTPPPPPPPANDSEAGALETMVEEGRIEEALTHYRLLAKKNPQDRAYRAGIELCEGLRALAQRDRMEAAQRFEAALELDPSSERAARELADMRRQATNERKGLLSRLMGKKEGPP